MPIITTNRQIKKIARLPGSIWALGFVSMFMDISSELIHCLLPIFMVTTLGASMTMVGAIEGIAEALMLITKIFSGTLSDYWRKRKPLVVAGYCIAAFTKPLFPLAQSITMVVTARFLDRIGKGVREAPRDALIGDITPSYMRGAAFGLRQSLDNVGAIIGPAFAIFFLVWLAGDMRAVMWLAGIPAALAVIVLVFGVKEPEQPKHNAQRVFHIRQIRYIGADYWKLVLVAMAMTLARFSEAFLLLKGQQIGLSLAMVPVVLIIMNFVYAIVVYPVGKLSDRLGRKQLLTLGAVFLILADLVLAQAGDFAMLALGVSLWGMHMGLTQGLLTAMVTDASPSHLRGTAYGVYNFACGIALLIASLLAGFLWDLFGPDATFTAGAGLAAVAIASTLLLKRNVN